MKKLICCLMMLLFCVGCNGRASLWSFVDNEAVAVRAGYAATENIEMGIGSYWWPYDETPQVWCIYGLYHFTDAIEFPNPIPVDFLPETLVAKPYVGAQVGVNFDNDGSFAGPVAGVTLQEILFMEYQFRALDNQLEETQNDEHKLVFGLRFRF